MKFKIRERVLFPFRRKKVNIDFRVTTSSNKLNLTKA